MSCKQIYEAFFGLPTAMSPRKKCRCVKQHNLEIHMSSLWELMPSFSQGVSPSLM